MIDDNEILNGADFVALRRLSLADDTTIAAVGETCERVPAAPGRGTVSDALRRLVASGKIVRATEYVASTGEEADVDAEVARQAPPATRRRGPKGGV